LRNSFVLRRNPFGQFCTSCHFLKKAMRKLRLWVLNPTFSSVD